MAGKIDKIKWAAGNLTVHDALSCAGLATIGAVMLATTANPFTWSVVFGTVATNVAGNLAASVWQSLDRAGAGKMLSGWKGIDENHVVVQTLRKAHLEAVRAVARTFREEVKSSPDRETLGRFADRVESFTKVEWTAAERLTFRRPGTLTAAEQSIRSAVLEALPMNFGSALAQRRGADSAAELASALVEGALTEIEIRTHVPDEEMPQRFVSLFRGGGDTDGWFDLFIRKAADLLRSEPAFEAIWNAEQQAYAQALLKDVSDRIRGLEQALGVPVRRGDASIAKFKHAIRNRPTELLVARYRVIPYLDRAGVLASAIDWARATDGPEAQGRLYVGPGGFGKTRFAIELVLAMVEDGWACTFLSDRNASLLNDGVLAETVGGGGVPGRLLVLDYAESQIERLKRVADAAAASTSGVSIRIVALARSPQGWWQGTQAEPGLVSTFEPKPHDLSEAPLTEDERAKLYGAGVAAFRDALAVAGLHGLAEIEGAEPLRRSFDRPLTVAMAAFLAARGVPVDAGVSVFEQVFVEERRNWRRLLGVQADNDPKVVLLHRAAAQVTLVQGAVPAGVHALMDADRRAAPYGRPMQDEIAAKLELSHGASIEREPFVRPIEPDLLGEHAAMAALQGDAPACSRRRSRRL